MARRLPPLLALRVFECAARHLSFTHAAEELCVTQAAVSHQIRALETWFGKPLFLRLSRSLKLTEAGERLLGPLTESFDKMAKITGEVSVEDGRQVLNVSMLDSFASTWILPRLNKFHARFPDIDLRFISIPVDSDPLITGDADVEIRYGDGNWPGHHVYELMKEDIYPVCCPSLVEGRTLPLELSELKNFELLHDVMTVDWRSFLDNFGITDINARSGFGFNHSQLVVQACIAGNGVALGRSALVSPALRSGELVRPFNEQLTSTNAYYVVCRTEEADAAAIKAFAYWLLDEIEAETSADTAPMAEAAS